MAGAWLTAIARALTTRETFDDIVAPAIADLQYEAGLRPVGSWRACGAVWLTLVRAIAHDFRADAVATFDQATTRRLLKVSTWIFLLLVAIPRAWTMVRVDVDGTPDLLTWVVSLLFKAATVLPVAMLPMAAVIAGRRHGRTILLTSTAVALVILALQATMIPQVQRSSSAAVVLALGPVVIVDPYPERRELIRAHGVASVAGVLGFALSGAALRLRRDWAIIALTLPIYAGYVWLASFSLIWMSGLGFDPVFRGWLPTLAVFAFGAAAWAVRLVLERSRLVAGVRA